MLQLLLLTAFLQCGYGDAATIYDQRQTGDMNVQLDLKNLHIFGVMKGGKEEYVDYDYAYDYSEMTIKPSHGTTTKPLNVTTTTTETVKDNITIATTAAGIEHTTESIIKNITSEIADTQTEPTLNLTVIDTTTTVRTALVNNVNGTSVTNSNITAQVTGTTVAPNSTNCKKGFVHNSNGNCELKLQAASNALLKIVKLSQKLKLRREKKNEDDSVE